MPLEKTSTRNLNKSTATLLIYQLVVFFDNIGSETVPSRCPNTLLTYKFKNLLNSHAGERGTFEIVSAIGFAVSLSLFF